MRYLWALLLVGCGTDTSPPTIHVVNATSNPAQSVYVFWYDSAGGPLLWNEGFTPGEESCRVPQLGAAFLSVQDAGNIRLEADVDMRTGQHWLLRATDGPAGRATVTFTQDEACR